MKTDRPLVSVVTVCLNEVAFIEETIISVLSQSYTNVEHIIIDGGSIDGTLGVIRNYEHRLAYWESGLDTGISNAFNRGIEHSNGKYIAFLNAGDTYRKFSIEAVMSHADEADILYGNVAMVDEEGVVKFIRKGLPFLTSLSFSYRMPSVPHPSVFARIDCYTSEKFNENFEYAMDYEWLRRNHIQGRKFRYIETEFPLANMRLFGKSNNSYAITLREVHRISVLYGDNRVFSWLYNRCFRTMRFYIRRILEKIPLGRHIVFVFRKVNVILRLRRWEM